MRELLSVAHWPRDQHKPNYLVDHTFWQGNHPSSQFKSQSPTWS